MTGKYFGKYTGIVKDNQDDQNLGHLQLSVPAIFPPEERVLARPALPYGFFFVPEPGAKVWAEFEGGLPGLCLWTGLQYVPGEWASEAEANPPTRRVIKSAAGSVMVFNDTSGEEAIEIHESSHGHVITLDAQGITIQDGANGHVVAMSSGGIQVESGLGAKVELTQAGIAVDGGAGVVEVKGSVIKLSSSAALPVARLTDQGVGNLGAPVVIAMTGNTSVLA